ncbi:hypothetical protein [Saccharopolyspora spinosa]|uniref:hypothetical protein n=1 Tax=Saccharopolyspora spinosa TaxID=60894 RepID=UPI0037480435
MAGKAAVEQFTSVAAKELGPRGISQRRLPRPADTDLLHGAVGDESLAATAHMLPLGRLGRPAEPTWGRSWPAPTHDGSPARTSATTAGWCGRPAPATGGGLPGLPMPNAV